MEDHLSESVVHQHEHDLKYFEDSTNISEDDAEVSACACAYCGINSPNSVVKCNTCNKWFCNSKTGGNNGGSHIVTHLVKSRHNIVSLHEDSDLGDTTLECYNCGNKNVFILGFVSAKQESIVVILCRLPCAQLKDVNWDTLNWQSLIEERQFLPWVANNIPTEEEQIMAKNVTYQQIIKLENQWRLNKKSVTMDEVENGTENPGEDGSIDPEEEILPILMRYNDAFQYQRSFGPLIKLESDYDKNLKESQGLEHILVSWEIGANNRHLASFGLSTFESKGLKVATGDKIILRHQLIYHEPWEGSGYIVRLPNKFQETFVLELLPSKQPPPTHLTNDFTAEFVWKGTSYDRMQDALRLLALEQESVSGFIYHKLLGHDVNPVEFDIKLPTKFGHPKLGELNNSQTNAVRTVLQRPLSLIQGPPGTGKTVTSAIIVYHLSKLNKQGGSGEDKLTNKVLVCAPSNVAVDHLAAKLDLLGLKVVRLTAKSREDVESSVSHLALHNIVQLSAKGKLKKLLKLKDELGVLNESDYGAFSRAVKTAEMKAINDADVICCTCVGAGDRRLQGLKFRTVLIDESTQASEPELLIPMVKGSKQVILVGDHQQLGPVILDKKAGDAGLKQSLFERLVVLGHVPIRLEVQYRMNPCLSEFPSNMFYEGSLQNGVTSGQRLVNGMTFPWPVTSNPMMFWGNYGREEISLSGNSFLNRVEAMNVEKIITKLFKDGITPDQIGVITPYEGQRAYIVQYMSLNSTLAEKKQQYFEVEVTSVDAFQGREKDFIILSCVRANDQQIIGFLSDPRRLNVALTRAKYGLIILGNPKALSRNALWNHLLIHFREKGCLVDGPLDNLQLLMIQLNHAKGRSLPMANDNQFNDRKKFGNGDFDTQSVVSYAPNGGYGDGNNGFNNNNNTNNNNNNNNKNDSSATASEIDTSSWPVLGGKERDNTYGGNNQINSNFAQLLNKLNQDFETSQKDIDEKLLSITNAFTMGLDLE